MIEMPKRRDSRRVVEFIIANPAASQGEIARGTGCTEKTAAFWKSRIRKATTSDPPADPPAKPAPPAPMNQKPPPERDAESFDDKYPPKLPAPIAAPKAPKQPADKPREVEWRLW